MTKCPTHTWPTSGPWPSCSWWGWCSPSSRTPWHSLRWGRLKIFLNTLFTWRTMEGEQIPIKISNHVSLFRLVACVAGILEAVLVTIRWRKERASGKGIHQQIHNYYSLFCIIQTRHCGWWEQPAHSVKDIVDSLQHQQLPVSPDLLGVLDSLVQPW